MTRIIIQGFYGAGNLGDEALLSVFLKELRQDMRDRITVFARDPDRVSDVHAVSSCLMHGRKNRFKRFFSLMGSDLFVLGGGGLLKDYGSDSSSLQRWLNNLNRAKQLGCKTALGFVGVENIRFPESEKLLVAALKTVDLILLRDEESRSLLFEMGLDRPMAVSADPALLLAVPQVRTLKSTAGRLRLVVCLRHWFSHDNCIKNPEAFNRFLNVLAESLDLIQKKHDAEIIFVPFRAEGKDDDRLIAERVIDRMTQKNHTNAVDYPVDTLQFLTLLNYGATIVLGMRLHALILAAASGIPSIGFSYMPKVQRFLSTVKLGDYCLPISSLSTSEIISTIERYISNYSILSRSVVSQVTTCQEQVRSDMQKLRSLAERD